MSFLFPLFLVGAIAAALPIVLHLLRRDVAPEVPFSAVRLLRRTPLEQTRRRRLRDLLLLAARVAALILLAIAFARPYFTDANRASRLHIVALDRSYSMGAPGVFERALELTRRAIDEAPRGDRIAVIAFDDRAEVIAAPGGSAEARASLQGIRPGNGGTRYRAVVTRAAELNDRGAARLIIVTDMQRAGWEDEEPVSLPGEMHVEMREVAPPPSNAAVVAVRRGGRGVIASIRNSGRTAASGRAHLILDNRAVVSSPFTVTADGSVDVVLAHPLPDRGVIAVEIDDPVGYVADNKRFVALDPAAPTQVVVVGEGPQPGFYITRALQAADTDSAFHVQVRSPRTLSAVTAKEMASVRAILLLSTRSLDRRAREWLASFVRGGGGLFVSAGTDVEAAVLASIMQWQDFSAVEQATDTGVLAATDLRHPIFRSFGGLAANLGRVQFSRAWRVRADAWDVAARFTDGAPALLERREGNGRVVVFASDLDRRWNDFPLHPAFVPFMLEAVRHLAPAADGRREYLVAHAPPSAGAQPGAYAAPADGRQFVVNVDVRESGAAAMSVEQFKAMLDPVKAESRASVEQRAQQVEGRQSLWWYGLLLMLTTLVAESVVGRIR